MKKTNFRLRCWFWSFMILLCACNTEQNIVLTDVLVVGGGTGGAAAGISSTRAGAKTVIVEETPWLGGMLTSAGVSASDGNHWMPSGIWGEFREKIRDHYGGADSVATGWISHTLFEPHVGASIFADMAEAEENLIVQFGASVVGLERITEGWIVTVESADSTYLIQSKILIDATELGDIAALAGCSYDVGMDARSTSGESIAPEEANDIIQDFTYVAVLKDYSPRQGPAITPSDQYDPALFHCSCLQFCRDTTVQTHPCSTMMTYAKLPRNKYMINWPIHGNDHYANMVEMDATSREATFQRAKSHTLDFVHFIQNELGYQNLGLADDEFATSDLLPFIPYHREGRRIDGVMRFNLNHIVEPYAQNYYRTGIAVGDYPIDHHHGKNPVAPELEFPKVPSFSIPLAALLPVQMEDLIMAEKGISVSNIVNGCTRLQPVILQIGQAAGTLAALSVEMKVTPKEVPVRSVQASLLQQGAYLIPSYDVSPDSTHFVAIQKLGALGLLRGEGEPYAWANRTWYYPDSTITLKELRSNSMDFFKELPPGIGQQDAPVNLQDLEELASEIISHYDLPNQSLNAEVRLDLGLSEEDLQGPLTRSEIAALLDYMIPLFDFPVDLYGNPGHR